jgi:hypothetical protein
VSETTSVTFKVLHVERIQGAGKLVALASVESLVRRALDAVPEGLIATFTADPGLLAKVIAEVGRRTGYPRIFSRAAGAITGRHSGRRAADN